uniref:Uncharacterized protein n=1 Tax=Anguilla anguilla TaxID=7936 RepID=A0A0E9RDL5_ANGAN
MTVHYCFKDGDTDTDCKLA